MNGGAGRNGALSVKAGFGASNPLANGGVAAAQQSAMDAAAAAGIAAAATVGGVGRGGPNAVIDPNSQVPSIPSKQTLSSSNNENDGPLNVNTASQDSDSNSNSETNSFARKFDRLLAHQGEYTSNPDSSVVGGGNLDWAAVHEQSGLVGRG